jgi:hypothetical protein
MSMKRVWPRLEAVKVLMNSLWFGGVLTLFIFASVFITIKLISFIKPIGMPSPVMFFFLIIGSFLGTALLMTIRQIIETDGFSDNPNRFKRVHERSYRYNFLCDDSELKESLLKIGYININVKNDSLGKTVTALFPLGVYNYPKRAGGYKKYEEKLLYIQITSGKNILNFKIGPSKWYIPTAVVYSNDYYLTNVENALRSKLDLKELEIPKDE